MPLISIISPNFNSSKYIESTYRSICAQTYLNWEWIVIDDCSADESWEILNKIAGSDKRVRVYKNEVNSGASVARNKGLDNSQGEMIAFLDIDDEWLPEKLEMQLKFMRDTQAVASCHSYMMMKENGEEFKKIDMPKEVTSNQLEALCPLATSFMMIDRKVIGNLRFNVSLRRRQDWIFWYEILKQGHVCKGLDTVLGRYRKDSINSISKNKFKMAFIQWRLYRSYFKFSLIKSVICFFKYSTYGVIKHYLSLKK